MQNLVFIPIDSKNSYFASLNGLIYRGVPKDNKLGYRFILIKGTVKASDWARMKKLYIQYCFTMANGKRRKFYGHRLIAATFLNLDINNPKIVVRHINPKETLNNSVSNLKLGTQAENIADRERDKILVSLWKTFVL